MRSSNDSEGTGLATDFAMTARLLGSGATMDATFRLIVSAAIRAISNCTHAGIFVIEDGDIRTVASNDSLVEKIDLLQTRTGEGPCLDAAQGSDAFKISVDLAIDPEYPRFGPQAVSLGIRTALGLRLFTEHRIGALNLYSATPHAFDLVERAKAVILAMHCGTAIDAAQTRADVTESHRGDLRAAVDSREIVGQAQGILMEREHLTATEAFDVLRRASQDFNVKLRDVAQQLVDTGENPRQDPAGVAHPRDA